MSYQLTTLPSGLRIASESLTGMESVTLVVSFNTGARQERPEEHGIAHLLEHMAFKGTERRNARKIAEEFDEIGGHVNAYTSMEQTVYHARVLAEHLPVAIDILADILQHSTFDAAELKREQEVIAQEIGMHHDSPEDLIFDYLHDVIYPEHPLGRSILGTPERVRSFTADDIRAYMGRHYHAPAMVISAAGRVDHDRLVALAGEHFSGFGARQAEAQAAPVCLGGEKRVTRAELEQVQVMFSAAGFGMADPDYNAAQLLSTLFGGGMSSRLFQEVREERGLAYTVQSFLTTYRDSGFFGIYASTEQEKLDELLPVLKDQTARLLEGVTAEELTRAKNQQKAALRMKRESPTAVAEWIARHLQDYGEYRDAARLTAQIDALTPDDLRRVAVRLFEKPVYALALLGPEAA